MMTIFKGDDTGGSLGKHLFLDISTPFDLTGCTVVFNYQGVERRFTDVKDGDRREIHFSHNETARMSVGTFKAVVIAVDAAGKVRTLSNTLAIKVSTDLSDSYDDNIAYIRIGKTIEWNAIARLPFEGQEIDLSTDDKKLAALGTIIEKLGGTVKATVAIAAVSLAALGAFGYDPPSNTNSYVREGVTYVQRGGLSNSSYVVTDVVRGGQPQVYPKYLHLLEMDDVYAADAEWYYRNFAGSAGGRCSARRDGNLLERNYDWTFDDAATFVVRVSAVDGRFASVGVANVGTNLTESFVRSGQPSRFYKCLAGHTVDGINENGVCAEVNVTDGRWYRKSGAVHGLGAVRWVLDNATNAQQAAEYLADNVYLPDTYGRNLHWLVADRTSTYLVENCRAIPISGRAVLTNFSRDTEGGEGYERYERLFNGASIVSQWWTLAYLPETRPIRFTDLGTNYESIWERWASKPREAHRGEFSGGQTWWQTVHTSVYDLQRKTLKLCVQETDDWYVFSLPLGGKVKSVNGRTGEVVLDAAAVNALPDDKDKLVENDNFKEAVATVSPPVELPQKWALANVTNENGEAVSAEDVGALPLYDGDMDIYGEPSWYFTSGGMRLGRLGDYNWGMYADTLGGVNGIWGWSRSIFDAMPHIALDYPDYGCIVLNADDGKKVYYTTGTEMVGDDREVAVKGDIPKWFATSSITNANGNAIDDEGKLTYGKIIDRNGYETHGIHAKNGGNNVYLTTDGLSAVDEGGYSPNIGLCVHSKGWAWSDYSVDSIHFCPSGYGQLYYYYFPYNSGTIALEGWQSLSRGLTDACTNRTADSECISTNICKLIAPHVEPVNVLAQHWDERLKANWKVYVENGDMKFSVTTNTDQTAFVKANPVLTDTRTHVMNRVVIEDAEMKFFTER